MTTDERIDVVEKSLRRYRVVIVALFLLVTALGAAVAAVVLGRVGVLPNLAVVEEIKTRRLTVVGQTGAAVVSIRDFGLGGSVEISDDKGEELASIVAMAGSGYLHIW